MSSFGERLRHERERRGISLEEVSQATKIGQHYLTALEGEDFRKLPDDVFSRGFVRAYAEFVGLDPAAAVDDYTSERRSRGEETPAESKDILSELDRLIPARASPPAREPGRRARAVPALVYIAAAIPVLALGAWILFAYLRPDKAEAVQPVARPVAVSAHEAAATDTLPAAEERAVEAQPTAARAESSAAERPPSVPSIATASPIATPLPAGLSVPEFGVSGPSGDRFEEGARVWFRTRVVGGTAGERIRHVWLREGVEMHSIELALGGPHWRTQSYKTMRPGAAGRWTVEARDAQGRVLASAGFDCVPR